MSIHTPLLLVLTLTCCIVRGQPASPPPSLNVYNTMDAKAGLTADGGQWGFHACANPDPSLPNVLLMGDSILIGYHTEAALQLSGKANVSFFTTGMNIGLGEKLYIQLRSASPMAPTR